MRELFIYWKLAPDHVADALAAARALQSSLLQRHPLMTARLYRRAESDAAMVTVMETYAQHGGLDAPAVRDIIENGHAALTDWCVHGRHVEAFDRLDP